MCLGYDLGHGNTSGCVPFSINDGNWHKVEQHLLIHSFNNSVVHSLWLSRLEVPDVVCLGDTLGFVNTDRLSPKHIVCP